MPTAPRNLLRRTVQVVTWALLVVVALGSRSRFGICTAAGCCGATAATAEHACGCCDCCTTEPPLASGESAAAAPAGSPQGNDLPHLQARGCTDCRIELSLPLEPAPLPRPVQAPDQEPSAVADLGTVRGQTPAAPEPCPCPFDTGPPRPDRRTELLATTILRR